MYPPLSIHSRSANKMSNHCNEPATEGLSITVQCPDGIEYELGTGRLILKLTKSGSSGSGGIPPRRGRGDPLKPNALTQFFEEHSSQRSWQPHRGGADDEKSSNGSSSNASSSGEDCNDGESSEETSTDDTESEDDNSLRHM